MEVEMRENEIFLCCLCARFTRNGEHFPCGVRNRQTGETPCDNFICRRCQREARGVLGSRGSPPIEKHREDGSNGYECPQLEGGLPMRKCQCVCERLHKEDGPEGAPEGRDDDSGSL